MDTPVFQDRTKHVLEPKLMPCPIEHYKTWLKSRIYIKGTNRVPEQDEMFLGADSKTVKRRFSLSDSYWIKHFNDKDATYGSINPYNNDFFIFDLCFSDKSVPSITTGGSINKSWRRLPDGSTAILKSTTRAWVIAEIAAVSLAQKLGLAVNEVTKISDNELYIHNFTKAGKMLMHFQPWDLDVKRRDSVPTDFGYSFQAVGDVFKKLGVKGDFYETFILFDAIVGNWDRAYNLTNWGYYKDGKTGENAFCPMYDFNLAHPHQDNLFLHLVRKQVTNKHRAILKQWKPIVEVHGYPCWLNNLENLL
jgi:hypothetical protein